MHVLMLDLSPLLHEYNTKTGMQLEKTEILKEEYKMKGDLQKSFL